MNSVWGIVAGIALCLSILVMITYLVLRAAAYFKRRFGASLWPGVIAMCISMDLSLIALVTYQNVEEWVFIALIGVAGASLLLAIYRDIKYYKLYSIPAFLLQLFLSVAQILLVIVVFLLKAARNNASYRVERVHKRTRIFDRLFDI